MPKVPSTKSTERQEPALFVLRYDSKRVLVQRPQTYEMAVSSACKHFPRLIRARVSLHTKNLDICDGDFVELTEESWSDAINSIHSIEVVERELRSDGVIEHWQIDGGSGVVQPILHVPAYRYIKEEMAAPDDITIRFNYHGTDIKVKAKTNTPAGTIARTIYRNLDKDESEMRAITFSGESLNLRYTVGYQGIEDGDQIDLHLIQRDGGVTISIQVDFYGEIIHFKISTRSLIGSIIAAAANKLGKSLLDLRAMGRRGKLPDIQTVGECGIQDGDMIYLRIAQLGGKPVIYFSSPTNIDATIKLSLTSEWKLSAIYPAVPIKGEHSDEIEWRVRTHQDGSLTEMQTGLDVAYLFWEAETNLGLPPSPPLSPANERAQTIEIFNPVSADLCDADSVVLSVDKITPYLDKALKALGLHIEARTSFITYWLPSILKHQYVALRFVPQAAYECAAPLKIDPPPDVVTRVFMIFRGIPEDQVAEWTSAQTRASTDVSWWRHVVGVDINKTCDPTLYRVLEWGGMEVVRK